MATIDILDLIGDGEFVRRSGTTLDGDGIDGIAADVANNPAAQTVLDARYGPGGVIGSEFVTTDELVDGFVDVTDPTVAALATDVNSDSYGAISRQFRSLPSTIRVAALGDSITVGAGASSAAFAYPRMTQNVAGSWRATVTSFGVAGESTAGMLARCAATIATPGITHLHIQGGTNNTGTAAALIADIAEMVALARAAGKSVTIGEVPPRGSGTTDEMMRRTKDYNLALSQWCRINGVPLAPVYAAMVDPTTGYLSTANDSGDATHPSNAGHLAMAEAIAATITADQIPPSWPVVSDDPFGIVSNSLFATTAGWADSGGTGAMSVTVEAAAPGDGLFAGQWYKMTMDNTAGGGAVNRQRHMVLDIDQYAIGDVLVLYAQIKHTAMFVMKLQWTRGATVEAIPYESTLAAPGPIMARYTVGASVADNLRIGVVCTVPAATLGIGYLGCVQVYNLTTGGLVDLY